MGVCGGYCVNSPTLKRFFVFHFVFPYVTLGIVVIHIYFLHFHSSNNPSRLITNNRISFFPFIFIKDLVFVSGILYLYFLQTHLGISSLSHLTLFSLIFIHRMVFSMSICYVRVWPH